MSFPGKLAPFLPLGGIPPRFPLQPSGEYNPPPSVPHMDGKRAAPRKGRRVVFAGIRFLCRAGPMCPAAGYAFFGGAHGPRPTGRYVEPRVGNGVPQWSAAEQMPLGYDVPSARQRRAGRRIPTPVTAGHTGPALQGAAVIQGGRSRPPLRILTRRWRFRRNNKTTRRHAPAGRSYPVDNFS